MQNTSSSVLARNTKGPPPGFTFQGHRLMQESSILTENRGPLPGFTSRGHRLMQESRSPHILTGNKWPLPGFTSRGHRLMQESRSPHVIRRPLPDHTMRRQGVLQGTRENEQLGNILQDCIPPEL